MSKKYTLIIESPTGVEHTFTNCTEFSMREYILQTLGTSVKTTTLNSMKKLEYVTIIKEKPTQENEAKLLAPTDTWSPQRRHMKDLFEGYIRAKYGWMADWDIIYNEGIEILRSAGQPVFLKYIENFMEMMRKKHFPERQAEATLQPRFYRVVITKDELSQEEFTMTFSEVIKAWPKAAGLVEQCDFFAITLMDYKRDSINISLLDNDRTRIDV